MTLRVVHLEDERPSSANPSKLRRRCTSWRSTSALTAPLLLEPQYGEAEPLYRRALEARERLLGPEHPDTLISLNNLEALLESKGTSEG